MQLGHGYLVTPDIVRHCGTEKISKFQSWIGSQNRRQFIINKAYYSHESGTWVAQRHVTHCFHKNLVY